MDNKALATIRQGAFAPRPRAVLEAILGLASGALEAGLSSTFNELEQQLFKLAEQARSSDAQNRCFESLREFRRARADIAPRFMLKLEAALARVGEAEQAPAFARMSRRMRDGLTLIDSGDFEESLVLQEIAGKSEVRHGQALFALGQRFAVLAGAPAIEVDELPVGPHWLCECLRYASSCIDIEFEHRVVMFRMFDRRCMAVVGALYDQINELCVRQRVLPHLQFQGRVRKTESTASAAAYLRSGLGPQRAREEPGAGVALGHAEPIARPAPTHAAGATSPAPARPGADAGQPPGLRPIERDAAHFPQGLVPAGAEQGRAPPFYRQDRAAAADTREPDSFETMRELLAGRRQALGLVDPLAGINTHAVRSEDVQGVLGAIQNKPVPPMMVGGKLLPRSIAHLKQDVLNQLRQLTPAGQLPRLSDRDSDTIDLVGMLFEHLVRESKPGGAAHDLLTRLQIPLLRVALKDKNFFTRRTHPARQLLNAVAEAGVFWLDDESDDRAMVDKMRLMVDRVTQEYDDKQEWFDELLAELTKHLGMLTRKSDVAERRHVDAAKGRERLELARRAAADAIATRLQRGKPSGVIRTLLELAWTDVLAITILRQGEDSEGYLRRLAVADRLVHPTRLANALADEAEAEALRHELETGLGQVGYHVDDVRMLMNLLFKPSAGSADGDPVTMTELAVKLKARSRLGEDADTDPTHRAQGKPELAPPLAPDEERILERLRSVPLGTWFEFSGAQQSDRVRRKLGWFSPITGRCLFVNQRGARTEETSLAQLAREMARGRAQLLETHKEATIDRAWNGVVGALRKFSGAGPEMRAGAPRSVPENTDRGVEDDA